MRIKFPYVLDKKFDEKGDCVAPIEVLKEPRKESVLVFLCFLFDEVEG